MTYGELKNFVLQLLDRYSVGGEKVALSYNGQADIVARIPALTKDGLLYLATSVRRLRETAPLVSGDRVGDFLCYHLPDDCYELCGGLLRLWDGQVCRFGNYRLVGGRKLLIPRTEKGAFLAEYFRYPALPEGEPQDGDALDCPPEAATALAYYVAAHLAMEDNNYLHGALHNAFELKLMRLREGERAEPGLVEDVYG
ncbi:MAG: hypothetical protein IJO88_06670 [Oscillospiraceae bacterium]|nr:hypothetical protein [Oscillospiraceae bacterium]